MSGQAIRESYRPSGKFKAVPFLLWSVVALEVGLLLGAYLNEFFKSGKYIIGFVPITMASGPGTAVVLAILRGHCRNRRVAGTLGLVTGAMFYIGSYYFGMLEMVGRGNAHRLDLLPSYIHQRMKSDVFDGWRHKPAPGQMNPVHALGNWVCFGLEFAAVCAILTAT